VTISAIRGRARGAGSEFALASDMRFASREEAVLGIKVIAVSAAAWALAVHAQERMRQIGVLVGYTADDPEMKARLATVPYTPITQRQVPTISVNSCSDARLTSKNTVILMSSEFASAIAECQETARKLAQQGDIMTVRASSTTRADACDLSINKAWNLCMIRGLYNITRVNCDCAQTTLLEH
jgi:enoyl-CoA hydratase/carnithine racemase